MNSGRLKLEIASKAFLVDFYALIIKHFESPYGALSGVQKSSIAEGIKTGYYYRIRNDSAMQGLFQEYEAKRLLNALNKFDKIRAVGNQPVEIEEPEQE